MDNEEKLAT